MTTTNPFDPKGNDRGPMTSGLRVNDDFRSHIDRLNGPWPCGPAVLPAIEKRETVVKTRKKRVRKPLVVQVVQVEQAQATDQVDADIIPAPVVITEA